MPHIPSLPNTQKGFSSILSPLDNKKAHFFKGATTAEVQARSVPSLSTIEQTKEFLWSPEEIEDWTLEDTTDPACQKYKAYEESGIGVDEVEEYGDLLQELGID